MIRCHAPVGPSRRLAPPTALLGCLLLASALSAAPPEAEVLAARPAPVARYLIADTDAETALARSAAPPEISERAGVWLLAETGYRRLEPGSNGFECLVGRAWSAPLRFGSGRPNHEFWSLEVRAPMCLNPEAVRVILPVLLRRTELAIAGASLGEVEADAIARYADGTYRPPHGVAMSYMLSKQQNLGLGVGHYMPHVMLYAPFAENPEWGGSTITNGWPFIGENEGNPHSLVIIPLGRWSDGSPVEHPHGA